MNKTLTLLLRSLNSNKCRQFSITLNTTSSSIPYFPYGKANFEDIRRSKQFYIDKTHLIPLLEKAGEQLFFVRPPRWGKTLLLAMLESYYDINKKDNFDELFGGLWIGKRENFTPLMHQFHVLHFDFSINVAGSPEDIQKALFNKINRKIEDFVVRYQIDSVRIDESDALSSLDSLFYCCNRNGVKLMILVDEYDRFANKLMFENPEKFKRIVEGERGDPTSSPISTFFERLKEASSFLTGFRSLIVGITPIALAGALGYNVSENISQNEMFGDLVGFTENDLRMALNDIGILNQDQDTAISIMKKHYMGYYFPGATQPLFNPVLSMYFLKKLSDSQFKSRVLEGKDITLSELTDDNMKISEKVFATLAQTAVSTPIIHQLSATNSVSVNTSIVSSFKLREIIEPTIELQQVWDNTLSFMYYHGMLTLSKDTTCKTLLIPNELAQKQYFSELESIVSSLEKFMSQLYKDPSVDNVSNILENIIGTRYIYYDNNFSKRALQHAIYCVFQAYYKHGKSPFKITTENAIMKHGNSFQVTFGNEDVDGDFDKRIEVMLESDKDVILLELKRIRPNSLSWNQTQLEDILQLREDLQPKLLKEQYNETVRDVLRGKWKNPKTIERVNEALAELYENELINLPLSENYLFGKNKDMKIVGDVVEKAKMQLCDYVKLLKSKESKPIHAFVVVQVGAPIIVQKV